MSIKTFFIILIIYFFSASPIMAANDCLSLSTEKNTNCSSLKGSYYFAKDQTNCGYLGENTICCCKSSPLDNISPKYIIIASVVVAFGIITTISFVLKKNEYEE